MGPAPPGACAKGALHGALRGREASSSYGDTDDATSGALMGGRAGVARHAAAERLAAVVEQALDALVLTDTDGVIVEWNAAATALLGLSAADARGRRLTEIAGALGATAAECATIDRALQGEVARFEPRRRAADGRLRHLAFVASPVRDAAGAVAGAFLMGRDVTELRAAERERDLAAARHRFLATASGLLAESLDLERTLEAVASLLVPEWADACVLSLLDDDGRLTA